MEALVVTWRELLVVVIAVLVIYVVEVLLLLRWSGRRVSLWARTQASSEGQAFNALSLEIAELRSQVARLQGELERLKSATPSAISPYNQAIQMARQGLSASEVSSRCGISRGEAELIVALYRKLAHLAGAPEAARRSSGESVMAVSLQAQVLALRSAVEAALTGTSADPSEPEVPWTSGQRLTAQVEAELPGGRYQIRVGTFQFDVELPVKAQVRRYLTARVRLRLSARRLRADPETAQAPGRRSAAGPPQVQISTAGRTHRSVASGLRCCTTSADRAHAGAGPHTVVAGSTAGCCRAGCSVQGRVGAQRPVLRVALGAVVCRGASAGGPAARAAGSVVCSSATPDVEARRRGCDSEARARESGSQDVTNTRSTTQEQPIRAQPLDPQVLGQVRSQLDVIEQRQIVWQGQAWPGQALEWRIEEPPERGAALDEPTPWTTHLRLTLPRLGEVSTELGLSGGYVRLRLAAQAGASAEALRDARSELTEALSQAGHWCWPDLR